MGFAVLNESHPPAPVLKAPGGQGTVLNELGVYRVGSQGAVLNELGVCPKTGSGRGPQRVGSMPEDRGRHIASCVPTVVYVYPPENRSWINTGELWERNHTVNVKLSRTVGGQLVDSRVACNSHWGVSPQRGVGGMGSCCGQSGPQRVGSMPDVSPPSPTHSELRSHSYPVVTVYPEKITLRSHSVAGVKRETERPFFDQSETERRGPSERETGRILLRVAGAGGASSSKENSSGASSSKDGGGASSSSSRTRNSSPAGAGVAPSAATLTTTDPGSSSSAALPASGPGPAEGKTSCPSANSSSSSSGCSPAAQQPSSSSSSPAGAQPTPATVPAPQHRPQIARSAAARNAKRRSPAPPRPQIARKGSCHSDEVCCNKGKYFSGGP